MARVARFRVVLAATGGVLVLCGSYLFWTMRVVRLGGVPLSGRLHDYGFGGPRVYLLIASLLVLGHVAAVVVRRRAGEPLPPASWRALGRIGLAATLVPALWIFTLVFFDEQSVDVIGPGPVVVLLGGLAVLAAGRSGPEPDGDQAVEVEEHAPWPRRSLAADVALVVGPLLVCFVVFLCGVGTVPAGSLLAPFAAVDASSFVGFLGVVAGVAGWLAGLGVLAGLTGPFTRLRIPAWVVFGLLVVVFPLTQQEGTFWVRVSAQAAIVVIAALGLNIVVGSAGLLDLGYVAFVAIGAYVAALTGSALLTNVNVPLPFLLVLFVVAPVVAAIFGVLLGAPTLRLRGDYLAIVTLGFGEIVRIVLNNTTWLTRGPNGISSIPDPGFGGWNMQHGLQVGGLEVPGDALYLYLALAVVVIVLTAIRRMNDSRIGRAWVAIREDEVAAAAMGINTVAIKLLAFAAGAFFAGMGGSISAHLGTQVSPDSYTFEVSVLILAMVVLGGIGNPAGVAVGAVILTFLPEKLRDFSDVRFLVFGLALVLVMRFRPEGLLPSRRRRAELRASGVEAASESASLADVRA
jgi:branched-chain amino acid transport system permease protein